MISLSGAPKTQPKLRQQFRKLTTRPQSATTQQPPPPSESDALSMSLPVHSSETPEPLDTFELILDHLKSAQDDGQVAKFLEPMVALLSEQSTVQSHQRKALLRVVSRHLATDNSSIIFPLVDTLMLLKVVRSNFAMASKLLFKLAKDDANDHQFSSRKTLELYLTALGRNCPMSDNEAFVYGYGALKFITLNGRLVKDLEGLGFMHLATLHLKVLCNQDAKKQETLRAEISNVMFQITSCIRNMMNSAKSKETFIEVGGLDLLLEAVDKYTDDVDVMCNLSRTLSILSAEDQDCLVLLTKNAGRLIQAIYKMLQIHSSRRDIVVRLTFCLGNLAANCDESRMILAKSEDTLTLLPRLLQQYIEEIVTNQDSDEVEVKDMDNVDFGSSGTLEDTAIKIIRVFANVSINADAGSVVALCEEVVDTLISICLLPRDLTRTNILLPTLATLNNLSFYPIVNQTETYQALKSYLHWDHTGICAETARVFGNLSRRAEIRQFFLDDGEFAFTVDLLSRPDLDRDLIYACIGIMVNMMSDPSQRPTFRNRNGLEKCVAILERCLDDQDWSLACLTCQALWNYCIDSQDITQCIDNEESLGDLEDVIVCLLEACNYTAHQRASCDDNLTDEIIESLESEEKEFCKVGLGLLKRLLDRDSNRDFDLLLPSGSE